MTSRTADLRAAVLVAIDSIPYSYAELLRQEVHAAPEDGPEYQPGVLCLAVAETREATALAIPSAVALTMLAFCGRVLRGIAAQQAVGLEQLWGMPRTLNAGDAFYALAYRSLLKSDAPSILDLLAELDGAARAYSEEMYQPSPSRRALFAAAAAMAAAVAYPEHVAAFYAFGNDLSANHLDSVALPDAARRELTELTQQLAQE